MILDDYVFKSCFAPHIDRLLERKHIEGFTYTSAKYSLIRFDRFCQESGITEAVITKELAGLWRTGNGKECRQTVANRMTALRQLALDMQSYGVGSYIPSGFSCSSHSLTYIMDEKELRRFFDEVDRNVPGIHAEKFLRLAMEYKVLFRVVFCCGLRISEARKLLTADVDLGSGKVLIRMSKGRKDRVVFLPADLLPLCSEYREKLKKQYRLSTPLFFPAADPEKPFQASALNQKFRYFWEKSCKCEPRKHGSHPTVHSLRHSFVVIRMNKWMQQGISLNAMMPYLSKYLGHASVEDTFYYYHQVDEAFKVIREKDTCSAAVIPEVIGNEK